MQTQETEIQASAIDEMRKQMIGQPIVKSCDMPSEMQQEAQDIATLGIEANTGATGCNVEMAAKYIKEAMDKKFGPTWHCLIGEGLAYDLTVQEETKLLMFYNGDLAILVYKS